MSLNLNATVETEPLARGFTATLDAPLPHTYRGGTSYRRRRRAEAGGAALLWLAAPRLEPRRKRVAPVGPAPKPGRALFVGAGPYCHSTQRPSLALVVALALALRDALPCPSRAPVSPRAYTRFANTRRATSQGRGRLLHVVPRPMQRSPLPDPLSACLPEARHFTSAPPAPPAVLNRCRSLAAAARRHPFRARLEPSPAPRPCRSRDLLGGDEVGLQVRAALDHRRRRPPLGRRLRLGLGRRRRLPP